VDLAVIQTRNFLCVVVVAIALVDMDATGLDPGQPLQLHDDWRQSVAVRRIAVQC
jgi:hypothetical protein